MSGIEAFTAPTINGPWASLATDRDNPPQWTDNDPGGYGEAHVKTLSMPPGVRDHLQGTFLKLTGPSKPVFLGRIESKPLPDGEVMAYGHQTWLDDLVWKAGLGGTQFTHDFGDGSGPLTFLPDYGTATYMETDPASARAIGQSSPINFDNMAGLTFTVPTGTNFSGVADLKSKLVYIPIGATRKCYFGFNLNIQGNYAPLYVYVTVGPARRLAAPDPILLSSYTQTDDNTGKYYSFVTHAGSYTGALSWTSAEAYDFDGIYVQVTVSPYGSYTGNLAGDLTVALSLSPGIFGVCATDNATVVATAGILPASYVVNDLWSRVPATVLPVGDAYRAFIQDDMTNLGRFIMGATDRYNDTIAKVLGFTDARYGCWYRPVGGDWACVPVYEDHSTTPDYECTEDGRADQPSGGVSASLMPGGIKDMCSMTRTEYKLADGSTGYQDTVDADATHKLRQLGITRVRTQSVDTHLASAAAQAGATSNSAYGRSTLPGTVTVTRSLHATNGGLVEPCDIEAGTQLLLHSMRYGDVQARIVSVSHEGRSKATLTLEANPFSPKRLKRALRKGSINAGGQVAGLA